MDNKLKIIDSSKTIEQLNSISECLSIIENQIYKLKSLGLTFDEKLNLQV